MARGWGDGNEGNSNKQKANKNMKKNMPLNFFYALSFKQMFYYAFFFMETRVKNCIFKFQKSVIVIQRDFLIYSIKLH